MARKMIDCREYPSESKCTLTVSADTEDELLDVVVPHAVNKHGHKDTPQLREELRSSIKESVST